MSVALRALMCVIAVAIAGEAIAQSRGSRQPPIANPSAQPAQPAAPDQRGTDQFPLSVKILPSPKSAEEAEKEQSERREKDEKAAVDKRLADETQRLADQTENLADYTRWLAGFTLLLFFAAVGQVFLFWIQLRLINKSLAPAEAAARAATVAAEHIPKVERAYLYIVIIAESISDAATRLAANQGELSGDGHIEMRPNVRYVFKNYGKTPALLKEISHTITHAAILPDEIDYTPADVVFTETFVAASDSTQELRCTFTGTLLSTQHAAEIVRGQRTYWFYGRVVYDDIFGDEQVHRFVWKYSGGSHGFRPVQHPKHSKST